MSQGASIAWTLFLVSGEAKFHLLLQDECESLLDWHCTLPEVLDLTPPFADDLAGTHLAVADTFDMPKCSWIIV